MATSIPCSGPDLKDKALAFLTAPFIATVARELGLEWRNTPLALPHLVAWFARQILGGNLSMPELARRAGSIFTPEAYCMARMKLPLALLGELLRRLCRLNDRPPVLWKGRHRLWHMDGTGISMPDTQPLQNHFGQPSVQNRGCGFPVAHVLCLFDAASGLIEDCIAGPLCTHDLADAGKLHPHLQPGDVLIADRAFESFAHLAMLRSRGIHAILPMHQRRRIDFRVKRRRRSRGKRRGLSTRRRRTPPLLDREVLSKQGRRDQITRWRKPANKPRWISGKEYNALPQTLDVRELRRSVVMPDGRSHAITLITTLNDAGAYPAEDLLAVLKGRWTVEVNLRHLKTTMKMEVLRSRTVAGIQRELWMFMIVYNAVRLVMLEAASRQQEAVDRISFASALYWVRHGDLSGPMPKMEVVAYRPDRIEPRVRKRRNDHYQLMTRPRWKLRQSLVKRGVPC
jgi:hypothetical protein